MPDRDNDPPFEGGAQPVPDRPPEVPTTGRSVMHTVVLIVSGLVALAAVLYVVARLGGG